MKLEDLKEFLDRLYGFDIAKNTKRYRHLVYYRKVFIKIAYDYGYSYKEIYDVINIKHDTAIHHYKTFSDVGPRDLMNYNKAIDHFKLPMKKIPNVSWHINEENTNRVMNKLSVLSRKELAYFEKNMIDSYLEELKKEEEYKAICYG